MAKNKSLGKGFDALLPDDEDLLEELDSISEIKKEIDLVDIKKLQPNPYQPREDFDEKKLNELANSIKESGVIQPIIVRKIKKGYQIIAGERRWRAAQKAGLKKVPVYILNINEDKLLEFALLENIHRKDLNPIEQAVALKRLKETFNYTHEELAKKVSLDRATITNILRLLKLPEEILEDIRKERLTAGHGRALLGLKSEKDMLIVREKILVNNWSVRKTEEYVKNFYKEKKKEKEIDPNIKDLEEKLSQKFGLKTDIKYNGKKGKIILHFSSIDEIENFLNIVGYKDFNSDEG